MYRSFTPLINRLALTQALVCPGYTVRTGVWEGLWPWPAPQAWDEVKLLTSHTGSFGAIPSIAQTGHSTYL